MAHGLAFGVQGRLRLQANPPPAGIQLQGDQRAVGQGRPCHRVGVTPGQPLVPAPPVLDGLRPRHPGELGEQSRAFSRQRSQPVGDGEDLGMGADALESRQRFALDDGFGYMLAAGGNDCLGDGFAEVPIHVGLGGRTRPVGTPRRLGMQTAG